MQITLITPVRNNADTIGDCLRSVAEQTVDCQHIILDGGSTDGTLEIIEKEKGTDAILISEPDQGMYHAINKGLKLAACEVVGVLNSDDYYPNDAVLTTVVEAFLNPTVGACYGDLQYVDKVDTAKMARYWRSGDYKRERFFGGWMPPHPTFFLRRHLYEKHGGYRLDMGTSADYELMLRMLLTHRVNAAYIPQVMVHMRNDGMSNVSLKSRIKANRSDRKAWRVNGIAPRPWTLIAKPLGKIGQWFSKV
ncbi:MAG: glycosyltransferase family 2 protein [Halioglobus sp.]